MIFLLYFLRIWYINTTLDSAFSFSFFCTVCTVGLLKTRHRSPSPTVKHVILAQPSLNFRSGSGCESKLYEEVSNMTCTFNRHVGSRSGWFDFEQLQINPCYKFSLTGGQRCCRGAAVWPLHRKQVCKPGSFKNKTTQSEYSRRFNHKHGGGCWGGQWR